MCNNNVHNEKIGENLEKKIWVCDRPRQMSTFCLCLSWAWSWLVLIYPSSLYSFRWGTTRWGSCRWGTLCGRGTAPIWSQCQITGIWRWPRWRRGLLSLWRLWILWLVHVSATLCPADDSPTRQRRKWRCHLTTSISPTTPYVFMGPSSNLISTFSTSY